MYTILPIEIQNQVREIFQALEGPVKLMLFTQDEGGTLEFSMCNETRELVEDIRLVSHGKAGLSDATHKELEKLDHPDHIQVFVTPTCSYCPQAVVLAHKLALASDQFTADMVEAEEFPQLAELYQVMGVPRP
jgi:hypothetical protein